MDRRAHLIAAGARKAAVKPKPVTDWTYEVCFSLTGYSPSWELYHGYWCS